MKPIFRFKRSLEPDQCKWNFKHLYPKLDYCISSDTRGSRMIEHTSVRIYEKCLSESQLSPLARDSMLVPTTYCVFELSRYTGLP